MAIRFPHFDPRVKPPIGAQLNRGDPISRGLVGCWLMNEGAGSRVNDLSGNGAHAVFNANMGWGASDHGHALYPTAANNQYANVSLPGFNAGSGTIAALVKTTVTANNDYIIFSAVTSSTNRMFLEYWTYAVDQWSFGYDGESSAIVTLLPGAPAAATGQWQWVVATWDAGGSVLRMYVNAKLVDEDTSASAVTVSGSTVYTIGGYNGNTMRYSGGLSSLSVYNRALTPSEITRLYREPFCVLRQRSLLMSAIAAMGSGTPATFKPAWATRRRQAIGGGIL